MTAAAEELDPVPAAAGELDPVPAADGDGAGDAGGGG